MVYCQLQHLALVAAVLFIADISIGSVNGQDLDTLEFIFRGAVYPNNSYILWSEVGEGSDALVCTTSRTDCCTGDNTAGQFRYPNNNIVPPLSAIRKNRFYVSREDNLIRLNRKSTTNVVTGLFHCDIPNSSGNNFNNTISTNIVEELPPGYTPPSRATGTIQSITTSGSSTAGRQFSLICTTIVEGSTHTPTITWLHGNSTTVPSGDGDTRMVSTVMSSGSAYTSILQFDPLQPSHTGMYTCQVTLLSRTVVETRSIDVDVHVPDTLEFIFRGAVYPNNSYILWSDVGEGNDALICTTSRIDCCTGDNTDGQFRFPNDNVIPLLNEIRRNRFYVSREDGLIRLNRRSTPDMVTGLFHCDIPDSSRISVNNTISINIVRQLPQEFNPPTRATLSIEPISSSGSNTAGQQFSLTCMATLNGSTHTPTIKWIDGNNMPIANGSGDTRMVSTMTSRGSTHSSNLQFDPLQSSHAGVYTCHVSVLAETVQEETSINITVVGVYLMLRGVNYINNSEIVISHISEDDDALLCVTDNAQCCRGSDNPNGGAQGEWYFPNNSAVGILGDPPMTGDFFYINRGPSVVRLNRRNSYISITGLYHCEVPDRSGVNLTVYANIVILAPSSPTIEMVTSQPNSITITWSQSHDVVDRYEIEYSNQGQPCSEFFQSERGTLDGSRREFTAEDLHEFSSYTITITAVNSVGSSQPVSRTVTTLPAAPSGRPQSLTVTSTSPTAITIQWGEVECIERNSDITGYTVRYGGVTSSVSGSTTTTFTATGLTPRTSYTFEVVATSNSGSGPSSTVTMETNIPESVGFLLNGQLYANNSIVTLDEIGEDSAALLCLTNKTDCCSSIETGNRVIGNWFFPSEESVPSASFGGDFHRNRGPSVIRLHRRNNAQTTGVFRCVVEDASGTNQQLYVGVYPVNSGSPSVTGILFDRSTLTLTCTSTSGPATTVIWMKNGVVVEVDDSNYQQSLRVSNTETAAYENILSSTNVAHLVGSFNCCVSNVRGSSCRDLTLKGISIHGNDQPLTVGEMGSISCVSDAPVNTIEWLDSQGRVVASVSSMNQLDLIFNPVNDSIHNTDYTCRVTRESGDMSEVNTLIKVIVPSDATVTVEISVPGSSIVGENFSLTCTASTTPSVLTSTTYWEYPDGSVTPNNVITFQPLRTSHAGWYTCTGRVESEALSSPLTAARSHNIRIRIPTPDVTILVPSGPLYAGTTITLTCTVTLIEAVDTDDVMMEVTWLRSGALLSNSTSRVTISPLAERMNTFTSTLTLSPLNTVDTNFICRAVARPSSTAQFVDGSDTAMSSTNITADYPLVFREVSYPNNSVLSLTDVGEYSSSSAILCITNRRPCCATPPNRHGEWYYPDGTTVSPIGAGDNFWGGREDNQTIHLNRRNNAQSPSGSYCCKLPDDSGRDFTWCITLVTINFTITPSGNDVAGEQYSLTCTADESASIQWLGPDNTLVLNTDIRMVTTNSYSSTLHFDPLHSEHTGIYTCQVSVFSGAVTELASIEITADAPSITVMVSGGTPTAGQNYSLTCTVSGADRLNPIITYKWFKTNPETQVGTNSSTLSFTPLRLSDAGQYRCDVTVSSTYLSEDITAMSDNKDLSITIPTPSVRINVPVILYASTPITLTCTISVDDAVNTDTGVDVTWTPSNDRLNSQPTTGSRPSFTSVATVSSLSIADTGFTCSAVIRPQSGSRFITASSPGIDTEDVTVQEITVKIDSDSQPVMFGHSYFFTCTVSGAEQLNPIITYQWTKLTNLNVETQVGTNSSTLSFSSLRLSDAGHYRCDVTVNSDYVSVDIVQSSTTKEILFESALIQLRMNGLSNCHEWALTDTSAKINDVINTLVTAVEKKCQCGFASNHITDDAFEFFPGSKTHVTFRARLSNTSIATTPQLISYIEQWLLSTRKITIQKFRLTIDTTCDLLITDLNDPECQTATKFEPVTQTKEFFQLKFRSTEHCITWNSDVATGVEYDIHKAILQVLTSRCQCNLPNINILNGVFSCQDSQDQTTYRSTITGTQSHNATELVEFIQDWVHSKPTMTIQWYTVKVDHTCPVRISSLGDPECDVDPDRRLCIDRAIARCTV